MSFPIVLELGHNDSCDQLACEHPDGATNEEGFAADFINH